MQGMNSARFVTAAHSFPRTLIALLSLVVLAVMSIVGCLIWSGYEAAIYNAETKTRDYAAILEARLEATLRRAEADLGELAREIPAPVWYFQRSSLAVVQAAKSLPSPER